MTDRAKVEAFIGELARTGEAPIGYDVGRFLQDSFGQNVLAASATMPRAIQRSPWPLWCGSLVRRRYSSYRRSGKL